MPKKHHTRRQSSLQIGERFGRWTVTGRQTYTVGKNWLKSYRYPCRCKCGVEKAVLGRTLANGTSRSCGCGKGKDDPLTVGARFGRLVLLSEPFLKGGGLDRHSWCRCRCDCGSEKDIRAYRLKVGQRSCGCLIADTTRERMTTHGGTKTRLHDIWVSMLARCSNRRTKPHKNYAGRGIGVCEAWKDFTTFRDWALTNGYQDDLTIERKEVNGDYEPGNCTWIPLADQSKNRRSNVRVTAFGETKVAKDWSLDPRCAVRYNTLLLRINSGWPAELAITSPSHSGVRPYLDAKT